MEQELRRRRRPLECEPLRSSWAARLLAPTLSLLLLSACGSGGSDDSPAPGPEPRPAAGLALAKTLAIAEGSASPCPYGGQLLQTGVDRNGNGVLDADEISNVQHICHGQPGTPGSPGRQALLEMKPEPAGANCAQGGTRVLSGLDLNGDRLLGSDEVLGTAYLCHGKEGAAGQQALFAVDEEPAGKNCAAGGNRLSSGLDRNGNGLLDPAEISSTRYLCRAAPTALLLNISDEPAGSYCSHGGKRLDSGLDLNGNQLLDASEISSSQRLCHGASGANGSNGSAGLNSLLTMSPEPAGVNCPQGGRKLSSGLDANGNQLLDPNEVNASSYLCHGSSGLNSLTSISNEPAGANCAHGGRKIDSGLDSNRNGVLDAGEAGPSQYVCNGAPGNTGAAGRNSLLEVLSEPAGAHCAHGGKRLNSGLDSNGNGMLEAGEVTASSYVCNGANGSNGSNGSNGGAGQNSLLAVVDEPAGSNCPAGGKKISSGLDANGNGSLDAGEVSSTAYVCHGNSSNDLSYQTVSAASTAMASNKGYLVTSSVEAELVLPAAPAVGDRVAVTGAGTGGWRIAQNSGQHIDATALGAQGVNWGYTSSASGVDTLASSANGMRLVAHEGSAAFLQISDDAGLSWSTRSSPVLTRLASSADGNRLFGSVLNGKLYTSVDRGLNWTARESDREWFTVSSSADGQVLLAGGPGTQLYVSTDGGTSWTARESARQWYSSAVSADGSLMLAGDFGGQLYVSTNSGASWTPRGPSKLWRGVAMSSDGRTMLAGPMNDYLYVSSDGGQSWEARGDSRAWFRVSVSGDGKKLFATVDNGSPSWSFNGGWSWSTPTGGGSASWTKGVLSTDGKRLLAATSSSLAVVANGRSSLGSSGSLSGEAGSAVMLQYLGNGRWLALSGSGMMTAQ